MMDVRTRGCIVMHGAVVAGKSVRMEGPSKNSNRDLQGVHAEPRIARGSVDDATLVGMVFAWGSGPPFWLVLMWLKCLYCQDWRWDLKLA